MLTVCRKLAKILTFSRKSHLNAAMSVKSKNPKRQSHVDVIDLCHLSINSLFIYNEATPLLVSMTNMTKGINLNANIRFGKLLND